MQIYICFRKYLKEFLYEIKNHFEIIVWSSSQPDYAKYVVKILEEKLNFKFDYCLSLADQICSEDKDFFVKDI